MTKVRVFLGMAVAVGLVLSACGGGKTPAPAATPTPTLKATPTPTPQPTTPTQPPATPPPPAASEAGKAVFGSAKAGCLVCHIIAGSFTTAPPGLAPELTRVGSVAATRKAGMSAEAYIRESLSQPTAFVVPGFQPIMPPAPPTGKDLEDLIAYLLSLK